MSDVCELNRSFPTNNAKIDPWSGGGFTALFKVGQPNDAAGNLILMRAATRSGFSPTRYAKVVALLFSLMAEVGIQPHKHVMDTICGN